MIRFGPAGNSEKFYEQGNKSSQEAPKWLSELGLNAYEYQCSKGVNISEGKAAILGENAKKNNIFLSIHAPYYINFANSDKEKRQNSIQYIMKTLEAARWMNAKRVVVHPGTCAGIPREQALNTAKNTFKELLAEADNSGFQNINICPEAMGKINQLGTVEEIIDICLLDERLIPTFDFGHIHARGLGSLTTTEEYETIFDMVENKLGKERLKSFHSHFSRIEYTSGGEKKHWTLQDTKYGPEFSILAKVLVKRKLEPVIICESRGTMAEDAVQLKEIYEELKNDKEELSL